MLNAYISVNIFIRVKTFLLYYRNINHFRKYVNNYFRLTEISSEWIKYLFTVSCIKLLLKKNFMKSSWISFFHWCNLFWKNVKQSSYLLAWTFFLEEKSYRTHLIMIEEFSMKKIIRNIINLELNYYIIKIMVKTWIVNLTREIHILCH